MEFEYYRLYMLNRPIDEIFKRVDGFSRYLASNYGLIYDTKTGKLSSQYLYCDTNNNKKKYYYRVNLIDDLGIKRCARSSRIILMAFDPRPNYDNLEAHHIDENTENNCLYNLAWKTHLENVQEHYKLINNCDDNNYLYTDENIHKICKGLCENLSFEDICTKYLKCKYNENIKTYIAAIRKGTIRKDISSQYKLPNKKRNTAFFTDDEIHQICKYIVEGYSNDEIYNKFGFDYPKGSKERLNILEILRRIKSKERFNRISDLYF